MKRILAILSIFLLLLTGCAKAQKNQKITILCTLFAHYDWTRTILGDATDQFDLILLGNGADLHSYEPSAADLAAIASADLMICNGGESEEWVEQAIKQTGQKNALKINEKLPLLPLPHDHTEEEHDHSFDEHTWLSLARAQKGVDAICTALGKLAPENQEIFQTNATAYIRQLQELDQQYRKITDREDNILVIADRHPFRYLAEDYSLKVHAAFDGCSAETEAGAATVANLAKIVDQHQLEYLFILENSKEDLAWTVVESTAAKNASILRLDSMQTMTAARIEKETYLSIMGNNLKSLKTALN